MVSRWRRPPKNPQLRLGHVEQDRHSPGADLRHLSIRPTGPTQASKNGQNAPSLQVLVKRLHLDQIQGGLGRSGCNFRFLWCWFCVVQSLKLRNGWFNSDEKIWQDEVNSLPKKLRSTRTQLAEADGCHEGSIFCHIFWCTSGWDSSGCIHCVQFVLQYGMPHYLSVSTRTHAYMHACIALRCVALHCIVHYIILPYLTWHDMTLITLYCAHGPFMQMNLRDKSLAISETMWHVYMYINILSVRVCVCVCGHSLNSRLWIKAPEIDCNILEYSVFDQLKFVSLDQWPMFQMHNSQLFKPLRCTHKHSQSLGTVVPTKTAMKGSNIISTRTLPPLSLSQDDSNSTKTKTENNKTRFISHHCPPMQ